MGAPLSLYNPLLRLPENVLLAIFSHGDLENVDKVFLALSCKRLLQFSMSLSFRIPFTPKDWCRAFFKNTRIVRGARPRDDFGFRKINFLNLCRQCLRYRHTRMSYWKNTDRVQKSQEDYWEDVVKPWRAGKSRWCPECWTAKRRKELNHS